MLSNGTAPLTSRRGRRGRGLTSRRGPRGRGAKTTPCVGEALAKPGSGCPHPHHRKLAWSVTFTETALTSPTCHLEARGRRGGCPHTLAFLSLGVGQGSGLAASAPGQAGASSPRGPSRAQPGRAAGGSSADVVPIMQLGRVAWSLSTQVCGAGRACQAGAARRPHGARAAGPSVSCSFLIKTIFFFLFSYKFASCKQVHKDPSFGEIRVRMSFRVRRCIYFKMLWRRRR